MSHYYEDFKSGSVHESRGRTVTESDIVNFAGLSGDFVELHTNEEFARKSPFGRRIAHGALVFSISTGLMTQMNLINDTVLAFYGIDKLRFTAPVFIGDTVRVTKRVIELKEKDAERGIVTFETQVLNQNNEPVIVYTDKLLVKEKEMRPLDGLVVLDLTRLLPGAAATMQLANFGAEVIKIEEPERGDYGRWIPPYIDGEGAVFHVVNRGKKSVVLDLKSETGRVAFLKLAATADVVVESFRPGKMQRLGLGYDVLRAENERLIYVSITGYGQHGPWAELAGHDVNYLALGGALDLNGVCGGPPAIPGIQTADLAGGAMQAVTGVLLALAARAKTGRGQAVDVSMVDGVAWMLPVALGFYGATGATPARGDGVLTGRYACYRVYEAADGRWLAVGALEPKFWQALCRALDCEQFIADQFAEDPRREEITAELTRIFRTRTAEEWFERLRPADACVTPVHTVAEVAAHFGLGRGDSVVAPRLSDTPGHLGGPPPHLGEQTHALLETEGLRSELRP